MSYDLKTIRQEFKSKGVFYTPPQLAEMLKSHVSSNPRRVYDPTCGSGNLLSVFPDDVPKYGQELNASQLQVAAEKLSNFTGAEGDTLTNPAFLGMKFDCIVANPPFSIEWEPAIDERFADAPTIPTRSRADFAFLLHILHYLADDGIAAVLSFPGILYRQGREKTIRQWMVEQGFIEKVIHIPGDTFVDTNIATACLVLRKSRQERDVEFIDAEAGKSQIATLSEIETNDFTLSPSAYIPVEVDRPDVDPIALEYTARHQMLQRLRADIAISRIACEMEGLDFGRYLNDIESVVQEFRAEHEQGQIKRAKRQTALPLLEIA